MSLIRSITFVLYAGLFVGGFAAEGAALAAPLQTVAPPVPAASNQTGQAVATVNAPIDLLGVPVRITAPTPVYYTGSAYRDDVSGQTESNADPAIADDARTGTASLPDAW